VIGLQAPTREERRVSRRLLAVGVVVLALALGVLVRFVLYTPTLTLHVVNDTSAVVRVAVCGSDPQVAQPGQTVTVDPNRNDARAACAIYAGSGDQAVGCLSIPTTRLSDGDTVKVSAMVRGVPADRCGD